MGIEAAFFATLGQDAELKTGKSGKPFLRLSVRAGDGYDAQWLSVLVFDLDAAEQADGFERGARVYIEGTLRTSEWTAADGAKRFSLSVLAWHCRLAAIGRNKRKHKQNSKNAVAGGANTFFDDAIPFAPEVR